MKNLNELVKAVEQDPRNKNLWSTLISFSEEQLEALYTEELIDTLKEYFKGELPVVVKIEMDKEWESSSSYYEFLSKVLVDGEDDQKLKLILNSNFDIPTLKNNPIIEFDLGLSA